MLRVIAAIGAAFGFGYADALEMPLSDFWAFEQMSREVQSEKL